MARITLIHLPSEIYICGCNVNQSIFNNRLVKLSHCFVSEIIYKTRIFHYEMEILRGELEGGITRSEFVLRVYLSLCVFDAANERGIKFHGGIIIYIAYTQCYHRQLFFFFLGLQVSFQRVI